MKSFVRFVAAIMLAGCVLAGGASGQVARFSYSPGQVPVGTVYHYTKSNLDGSEPWSLATYVAAPTRIDVVKWGPEPGQIVNVAADFDWTRATATHIEQWNVRDGKMRLSMFGNLGADEKSLSFQLANGQGLTVASDAAPIHVFGFDMQSLNIAFRFLTNPKKGFEGGMLGSNITPSPERPLPVVSFGKVKFEFAGEEMLHNAPCLKYRIVCTEFKDKPATIWFNRDQRHIEKIESSLPNSNDWTTYKLELVKVEKMTPFEWLEFKQAIVKKHES